MTKESPAASGEDLEDVGGPVDRPVEETAGQETGERQPGSPGEMAARLESWALEAGFDRAGVAGVEPVERGEVYLRWLEDDAHAGMGYLRNRIEARLEPERILEGARSVLCVALQYEPLEGGPQTGGPVPDNDLWPGVAKYAYGRDYHNLMGKRLKKLARRIRDELPGTDTRWYVDTGPVLERELAARAGIGVQGKNTCLLSRQGSWFLLGELFLTLELPPAAPLTDLCGRCTRCLGHCPTGALTEPYRLDSNLCISYWTIEHRGAIPEPMREQIGEWVFGCDVCQDVCPWNVREQEPADHPDLHLPPRRAELDLIRLLAMTEGEYQERFRGNAMKRARLEGLKRNAATVMGNRREERYVEPLRRALEEETDPAVREHAAWALERIRSPATMLPMAVLTHLKERLGSASDVRFAFLFGSRGKDSPRPDSDWDVAVWLDPSLSAEDRFRRRLELIGQVEDAVVGAGERGEADVVVLNDAPPLLAHRALQGKRLLLRDPVRYVRFFVDTLGRSFDEQHWRDLDRRERRRRLAEGTFGRP